MSKNKISAQVVADSVNPICGSRITSMVITMPRFILPEFLTHRMFSRNSASSRAIPFDKMVKMVETDPFIPIAWQKDHSGMQGTEYVTNAKDIEALESEWGYAASNAVASAKYLNHTCDVTKQICNRLLEPFMWHKVLVTATEFDNFFDLRCPQYGIFYEQVPVTFKSRKDLLSFVAKVESDEFKSSYDSMSELDWLNINKGKAEIHMMALAEAMWDARNESTPKVLQPGEWHLPFGDNIDRDALVATMAPRLTGDTFDDLSTTYQQLVLKICGARCARTSYNNFEGGDDYPKDYGLYDRLVADKHASPREHAAECTDNGDFCYNLRGFASDRYLSDHKALATCPTK